MLVSLLPANLRRHIAPGPFQPQLGTYCWDWSGRMNRNGYGRANVYRRAPDDSMKRHEPVAHRAVYEALVGPIPPGRILDHLCERRCCVNPVHMEPVTHAENTRRGKAILFKKRDEYAAEAEELSHTDVQGSGGNDGDRAEGCRSYNGNPISSGAAAGEAREPEGTADEGVAPGIGGQAAGSGKSLIPVPRMQIGDSHWGTVRPMTDAEMAETGTGKTYGDARGEEIRCWHVRNTLLAHTFWTLAPWVAGAIAAAFTALVLLGAF